MQKDRKSQQRNRNNKEDQMGIVELKIEYLK